MVSLVFAGALGLGLVGQDAVGTTPSLPAQTCTPSPCLPPTVPTSVTPLPDVTTSISASPAERGQAESSGSASASTDDGLPVTGGDVLALTAMGIVLVGCAAVSTAAIRRRRSRLYG